MITQKKRSITQSLFDLWCSISLIGIWPRFIEPTLISTSNLSFYIPNLPKNFEDFKIVQFSDLHFNDDLSDLFLKKLSYKILKKAPDLILFTGDFLCYSKLEDKERLKKFLNTLRAPYGCFAILGNHDYQNFVSINSNGEYDLVDLKPSTLIRGFKRLFSNITLKKFTTHRAKNTGFHENLLKLLEETPFKVLHNETTQVSINDERLNLCGLGEYSLAKCFPDLAFTHYDKKYPGIILSHNPDSLSLLKNYPGDLILSGHTHGGQVNLWPFKKKFTILENRRLVRGLVLADGKKIYINRGIGSCFKFRWFAMPEILHLTLKGQAE